MEAGLRRGRGESRGERLQGAPIFRDADDPTVLVILFEWDDLDRLRRRVGSGELREKMRDAGVRGDTEFSFLEQVGRVPV